MDVTLKVEQRKAKSGKDYKVLVAQGYRADGTEFKVDLGFQDLIEKLCYEVNPLL